MHGRLHPKLFIFCEAKKHGGLRTQNHFDPRGWPQPSPQVVQGKAVCPEPVSTIKDCSCPGVPTLAALGRLGCQKDPKNIWPMWAVIEMDTLLFMLNIFGFFAQRAWNGLNILNVFMSPLWKTGGGLLKTNQCQSGSGTYSGWFSGPGFFNLLMQY